MAYQLETQIVLGKWSELVKITQWLIVVKNLEALSLKLIDWFKLTYKITLLRNKILLDQFARLQLVSKKKLISMNNSNSSPLSAKELTVTFFSSRMSTIWQILKKFLQSKSWNSWTTTKQKPKKMNISKTLPGSCKSWNNSKDRNTS